MSRHCAALTPHACTLPHAVNQHACTRQELKELCERQRWLPPAYDFEPAREGPGYTCRLNLLDAGWCSSTCLLCMRPQHALPCCPCACILGCLSLFTEHTDHHPRYVLAC